jgi:hypothetical protein
MIQPHDLPMAARGLISYRYAGRFGFIMIGARSHDDALMEAQRSTRDKVTIDKLEIWNDTHYEKVTV